MMNQKSNYSNEPSQIPSKSGLYTLRLYDRGENRWIDCLKNVSFDDALARWKVETNNGTEHATYQDGDYYISSRRIQK